MRVLAIDVGVKHLAVCILSEEFEIDPIFNVVDLYPHSVEPIEDKKETE